MADQIIVTGASKGIGASIAEELDRRGFAVVNLSRSGGSQVGASHVCDVTDEQALRDIVQRVGEQGSIVDKPNN